MLLQKLKFSASPYTDNAETATEEFIRNSFSVLSQNLKQFNKSDELKLIETGIKISTFLLKEDFLSIYKSDQLRFKRNIFRQYV